MYALPKTIINFFLRLLLVWAFFINVLSSKIELIYETETSAIERWGNRRWLVYIYGMILTIEFKLVY